MMPGLWLNRPVTVIGVSQGRLNEDGVAHSTPNLFPLVVPPSTLGLG